MCIVLRKCVGMFGNVSVCLSMCVREGDVCGTMKCRSVYSTGGVCEYV